MHSFVSRPRLVAVLSCSALALPGLGLGSAFSGSQPGEPAQAPDAPHAAPSLDQMGRILVQGLHSVEGCLGVDVADFNSGKNTIVAWFENKAAVERWYNHPAHARLMGAVGARPGDRTPLEHVTDPDIPIMVMASISFNGEPAVEGSGIPFSQISIELYTPLPGGASVNGRLAPDAFEVEHHRVLDGAEG